MKSFIFDLDGTLIDSYYAIVLSIYESFKKINLNIDTNTIYKNIIQTSVSKYFKSLENDLGINLDFVRKDYLKIEKNYLNDIKLMPNALKMLEELYKNNSNLFIFTHRGESRFQILKNNNIDKYFIDTISPYEGVLRKPSGDGINYLCNKYNLDKKETYYVGDRLIDMESAKDAGVFGILLTNDNNTNIDCFKINDLLDLIEFVK